MTTIRRSDAQLDAEAAGRVVSPALRQPRSVLTEWRVALASEPPVRTTTPRPPQLMEVVDGVRMPVIDHGTRVGFTESGALVRWLEGSGGTLYPGHDALLAWDRLCRKKHRSWSDHHKPECMRSSVNPCNCGGRPICSEIARSYLVGLTSIEWAAEQCDVSFPRAENLLRLAIDWMARQQKRWVRQGQAVPVRHEREGAEHCETCRREVAG